MIVPVCYRNKVKVGERLVIVSKANEYVRLNGEKTTFCIPHEDKLTIGSKLFVTSDYELVPKLTLKLMVAKTKTMIDTFKRK